MNIYVFKGDSTNSEYGVAVVYAHTADEARKLLRSDDTTTAGDHVLLAKTIQLSRNPKAQVVARYFE